MGNPVFIPTWADASLSSPETGRPLYRRGPFLTDGSGGERWPVVEEIPYLRAGRKELLERVNAALDRGDHDAALAGLLRDQDDWAPTSPPSPQSVRAAVSVADAGGPAREVMHYLGFGPVADYFSYRLSDPVYLAGLCLIQTGWDAPQSSFELACGIGHYTRELSRRGIEATAGDVVFAKLWLARRYLVPEAKLVCFDASRRFPVEDGSADLALCQDAFYFLPDKPHVAAELGRIAGDDGTIVIGHSHNAAVENFSSGEPAGVARHLELFPGSTLYDDAELTEAAVAGRDPTPREAGELSRSEAVSLVRSGSRSSSRPRRAPDLLLPPPGTPLRLNPLYKDLGEGSHVLGWPSGHYEEEYAPRSGYLPERISPSETVLREGAEEGVGASPEIDRLVRHRVLLDLPEGM
ncbi:class I SAM-dependent methyltransferase [Rubrobacter aplysinae]|uniref:class I SAM-dependent methyltransferase n=1 Tax=Rubrobacter aplysinae TaxID=909625 RepID=UPI00069EDB4C|nr:methyltransferase domain-containing protein [Rubrobacter aplysinae]